MGITVPLPDFSGYNLNGSYQTAVRIGSFTPTPIMFYMYVLRSIIDKNLYIGSTNDLRRRFKDHNNGKVYSTKKRKPFELIYYEAYKSEKDARKREHNLKLRSRAFAQLKKRIQESLKT